MRQADLSPVFGRFGSIAEDIQEDLPELVPVHQDLGKLSSYFFSRPMFFS